MINLSLGGVRDPDDEALDTFSPPERDAIAYATSKGVVVVSAVGNGDEAPTKPWRFADWPSALPHVIGVGALRPDGSVPAFSNRDPLFVDLAAPGDGHLLDDPAEPDRQDARRLHHPVLGVRARALPRRDRDVVRRAAGVGRRGAAARRQTRR